MGKLAGRYGVDLRLGLGQQIGVGALGLGRAVDVVLDPVEVVGFERLVLEPAAALLILAEELAIFGDLDQVVGVGQRIAGIGGIALDQALPAAQHQVGQRLVADHRHHPAGANALHETRLSGGLFVDRHALLLPHTKRMSTKTKEPFKVGLPARLRRRTGQSGRR